MKTFLVSLLAALALATTAQAATVSPVSTIEMQVDGLVCAFCAQGIEKKLRKEAATADVLVSLEHGVVAVALKPKQDIPDATLTALLKDAGYTLREVKRTAEPLDAVRARMEKP
jgi:copper chaperone CopZ